MDQKTIAAVSLILLALASASFLTHERYSVVEYEEYTNIEYIDNFKSTGSELSYRVNLPDEQVIVHGEREIGTNYEDLGSNTGRLAKEFTTINESIAYIASNGSESFVVYDGEKYGERVEKIYSVGELNNNLAYAAKSNDKTVIVLGDKIIERIEYPVLEIIDLESGRAYVVRLKLAERRIYRNGQLEPKEEYDILENVRNVNGKLAYTARKIENGSFVRYSGKNHGERYYKAYSPFELNGKLAYLASNENQTYIVTEGRILKRFDRQISWAKSFRNGTLIKTGWRNLIYNNSKALTDLEYDGTIDKENKVEKVNGKVAYLTYRSKSFLVKGDEKIDSYDQIHSPTQVVDQDLVFLAERGNKTFLVNEGETKFTRKYNYRSLEQEEGKIIFSATDSFGYEKVYFNGNWSREFKNILAAMESGGKPAYIVDENGTKYLIHGQERRKINQQKILELFEYKGEPVYLAEEDGKMALFSEGENISKKYQEIYNTELVDGEILIENGNLTRQELRLVGENELFNGTEILKEYEVIDGKFYYLKEDNGKEILRTREGKIWQEKNIDLSSLETIDEKPLFTAQRRILDKEYLVYDGRKISEFQKVDTDTATKKGDKLAYAATDESSTDSEEFVVIGSRRATPKYSSILEIENVDGQIHFLALENVKDNSDSKEKWIIGKIKKQSLLDLLL